MMAGETPTIRVFRVIRGEMGHSNPLELAAHAR